MAKLKLKSGIYKSTNKSIFYNFCCNFFYNFFFLFFHVFRCLKVYQLTVIKEIEKDFKKKVCKRYQNLSKEEKDKKRQYGIERLQKSFSKWKTKACCT